MKESIGNNIQHYRKQRGFSREELAEALNVSKSAIEKVENGINLPSLENFITICELLDVPSDFILAGVNKKFEIAAYAHKWQQLSEMSDEDYEFFTASLDMFLSLFMNRKKKSDAANLKDDIA